MRIKTHASIILFFILLVLLSSRVYAVTTLAPYNPIKQHFTVMSPWTVTYTGGGTAPAIYAGDNVPSSGNSSLRFTYPPLFPDGSAPGKVWINHTNVETVFVDYYFKYSSNWTFHTVMNKQIYIKIGDGDDNIFVGVDGSRKLNVQVQRYDATAATYYADIRYPPAGDLTSNPSISKDTWYQIRVRITLNTPGVADGVLELYCGKASAPPIGTANGTNYTPMKMIIHQDNVTYRKAGRTGLLNHVDFEPVWGGNVDEVKPNQTEYFLIDYARISTANVDASVTAIPPQLIRGKTPATYTPISGWTTVATDDFEGARPSGRTWYCGDNVSGTVCAITGNPHTGTKSLGGEYYRDQFSVHWKYPANYIGDFDEIAISWWEYIDSGAKFQDEFFQTWFKKIFVSDTLSNWQTVQLDWFWCKDDNTVMRYSYYNTKCELYGVYEYRNWNGYIDGIPFIPKAQNPKLTPIPTGAWHNWELRYKPSSAFWYRPGADFYTDEKPLAGDGYLVVYVDNVLYWSSIDKNFNGSVPMSDMEIMIGGTHTKLTWMTDVPVSKKGPCNDAAGTGEGATPGCCNDCSSRPEVGMDGCTWGQGVPMNIFSAPACRPGSGLGYGGQLNDLPIPNFHRYFDDIVLIKRTTSSCPEGSDCSPPVVDMATVFPASGSTVDNTSTTVQFKILESDTDDTGLDASTITATINGVDYTCSSTTVTCRDAGNASCNDGDKSCTFIHSHPSNWTSGSTIPVRVVASDLSANVMDTMWQFYITPISGGDNLSITTSSPLTSGVRGQAYSTKINATGGTGTYSWSTKSSTKPGAPYPGSSTFDDVTWDFSNVIRTGIGSDIWPITWGNDNLVWTSWGDGGGPLGANHTCRTRRGIATISGNPPSLSYVHVTGCKADDSGCTDVSPTHDTDCNTLYANTLTGYPGSMIDVEGTLYQWSTPSGSTTANLYKSTNGAETWTSVVSLPNQDVDGNMRPGAFIQFGPGHSMDRDQYVYMLFSTKRYNPLSPGERPLYLVRIPKASIDNSTTWTYYTSTNPASPTWGTFANRQVVFNDPTNTIDQTASIAYLQVKKKYVMIVTGNYCDKVAVYDSPEPWGPWTTVSYTAQGWLPYKTETLGTNIVPKWIFSSDTVFWVIYSAANTASGPYASEGDKMHILKGTFSLSSGSLPPGLELIKESGYITGIPTATGTYTFTVVVNDSINTASKEFQLTINSPQIGNSVTITHSYFQDTYLSYQNTTTNYSSNQETKYYAFSNGTVRNRMLDNVSLSLIPANVRIDSATLKYYLYTYDAPGGTNPSTAYVYPVTGLTVPISTVTAATFDGTIGVAESSTAIDTSLGYKTWNITNMVQAAYSASANLFFAIDAGATGGTSTNRHFASADHTTTAWRPEIVINYTPLETCPTPPCIPISSPGRLRVVQDGFKGIFR